MKKHYTTKQVKSVMRDALAIRQIENEIAFLPSEINELIMNGETTKAIEATQKLSKLLVKLEKLTAKNSEVVEFDKLLDEVRGKSLNITVNDIFAIYNDYFEIFDDLE